jgi:hypothetical protein
MKKMIIIIIIFLVLASLTYALSVQYPETITEKFTDLKEFFWDEDGDTGLTGTYIGNYSLNLGDGNLTIDTNILFVDSTNNRVLIGQKSGFDPRIGLSISGDLDLNHTATENDDHAMEIDVDAAGYGDVKGIDIVYTTGAISAGEEEEVILINIDESEATGGDVIAVDVLATEGSARIYGLETGALVNPVVQLSGTFENMDTANNSGVDNLSNFISSADDHPIFSNDNDYIIIGDEDKFEELEFLLNTTASNPGIKPTFEYSTGVGTWGTFSPADGTNGMRNTGVIAWFDSDIPTWATGAGSEYLIRINRTQNNLNRVPIEDKVQIASVIIYKWDKNGDLVIREINASSNIRIGGESVPTTTDVQNWIKDNVSGKPNNGSSAYFDKLAVGSDNFDKEFTVNGDMIADTYWLDEDNVIHIGDYTTLYNTGPEVFFMNIVTTPHFVFYGYDYLNLSGMSLLVDKDVTANNFNYSDGTSVNDTIETKLEDYPLASSLPNVSMSEVFDNHSKEGYLKNKTSPEFENTNVTGLLTAKVKPNCL